MDIYEMPHGYPKEFPKTAYAQILTRCRDPKDFPELIFTRPVFVIYQI